MLSQKLTDALNEQMNYEFESAHAYLAMAGCCSDMGLDGFTNFFMVQYQEEISHAMKFYYFIDEMDGRIEIKGIPNQENNFESPLAVFEAALKHEQSVTKRIYNLMDIAIEEKEHATKSFLEWFVDEQVEEESGMKDKIKRLERIGENSNGLYMMDAELAKRVYTPPAE